MSSDISMQALARLISESGKLNDELLAKKMRGAGVDNDTAELALTLIPFAFARVLFKRGSFGQSLRLTDDADIGGPEEEIRRVVLMDLPYYREAYDLAVRSFETDIFNSSEIISIAGRSAEFHLINSLLLEKKNLADFVFSRPRFLRLTKQSVPHVAHPPGLRPVVSDRNRPAKGRLTGISGEMIARVVDILGSEGISDDEIEAQVLALAGDSLTARRLIDWIPETFGLVFVSHLGRVTLPATLRAKNASGQWEEFPFSSEPLFAIALLRAQSVFHEGPRLLFKNVSIRSSMLNAANQALNAGVKIEGAVLSGPALIGIPAEVYRAEKKSFWRRIFR